MQNKGIISEAPLASERPVLGLVGQAGRPLAWGSSGQYIQPGTGRASGQSGRWVFSGPSKSTRFFQLQKKKKKKSRKEEGEGLGTSVAYSPSVTRAD